MNEISWFFIVTVISWVKRVFTRRDMRAYFECVGCLKCAVSCLMFVYRIFEGCNYVNYVLERVMNQQTNQIGIKVTLSSGF